MKLIAITPDYLTVEDLISFFRLLEENGASHLYVRSPFILNSSRLKDVLLQLLNRNIIPVIPYEKWLEFENPAFICHFKEHEKSKIKDFREKYPEQAFSFSAHGISLAEQVLENGAAFVFLSPVFPPYSKKDYNLKPLSFEEISYIVDRFGERVVLLGGIDFERLKELKLRLVKDFSVAGITMFFGRKDF